MPRKPRPNPIEQGSYAYIWKHFFAPLMQYKPYDMEMKPFLEDVIFDIKNREIFQYKALRAFKMPGLYYFTPIIKVQGVGFRDVREGQMLYVRMDAKEPNKVDVEFQGGQGEKDQVFELTQSEWGAVALNLQLIEDRVR